MFGFPRNSAGFTRYLKDFDEAKSLDPDAFKPAMIPHYSVDQLRRQEAAMRKVRSAANQASNHDPASEA
jgi:hypothetical protein